MTRGRPRDRAAALWLTVLMLAGAACTPLNNRPLDADGGTDATVVNTGSGGSNTGSGGTTNTGGGGSNTGSGGTTNTGSGGTASTGAGGTGGSLLPSYTVSVSASGGPAGTTILPTSPTPGAVCSVGSCRVPSGGVVNALAPALLDWYFNGWTGSSSTAEAMISFTGISRDSVLVANYINRRQELCLDTPPANATSTDQEVTVSYTTAGGWMTPPVCAWSCNPDFCVASSGGSCVATYLDQIAFMGTTTPGLKFYGGDQAVLRSVGTGQGVTPASTVTMDRFGFHFPGGFVYGGTRTFGAQTNILRLDVRNASGAILGTYTTSLPGDFRGDWVYWNTGRTTLNAGTPYIFTSFLTTAFTQRVTGSSAGDTAAGYPGGGGYAAEVTSGDIADWSLWFPHGWDFDFRVQLRNAVCP